MTTATATNCCTAYCFQFGFVVPDKYTIMDFLEIYLL